MRPCEACRQRGAVAVEAAIGLGLVVMVSIGGIGAALAWMQAQGEQRTLSALVRLQSSQDPASVAGELRLETRDGLQVGTSVRSPAFALWPQRVTRSGAVTPQRTTGGSEAPPPQLTPALNPITPSHPTISTK
jgi:hypothetical protein